MPETSAVDAAIRRLQQALEGLEAALERQVEAERGRNELAERIHGLGMDRARLASELDQASARSHRLEDANRAAMQRLDDAIATIRSVISPDLTRGVRT